MTGNDSAALVGGSRTPSTRASHLVLPILVCMTCVYWSTRLPVDMAPDESMRLMIPLYIVEHGQLPVGSDPAIRNAIWGTSYGFVPYATSLIAALFIKVASFFTSDSGAFVLAARFVNAIFAGLTVYVCELIGLRVFKDRYSPVFLALVTGFLPQFVFLGSYLNNDVFTMFCSALVVLGWVKGWTQRWDTNSLVFLGLSLGLTAISYYFAYGYLLISVGYYFVSNALLKNGSSLETGGHRGDRGGHGVLKGAVVIGSLRLRWAAGSS